MELKILWMYHDLMDLYGDKGNIETLRYRASKRCSGNKLPIA